MCFIQFTCETTASNTAKRIVLKPRLTLITFSLSLFIMVRYDRINTTIEPRSLSAAGANADITFDDRLSTDEHPLLDPASASVIFQHTPDATLEGHDHATGTPFSSCINLLNTILGTGLLAMVRRCVPVWIVSFSCRIHIASSCSFSGTIDRHPGDSVISTSIWIGSLLFIKVCCKYRKKISFVFCHLQVNMAESCRLFRLGYCYQVFWCCCQLSYHYWWLDASCKSCVV